MVQLLMESKIFTRSYVAKTLNFGKTVLLKVTIKLLKFCTEFNVKRIQFIRVQ